VIIAVHRRINAVDSEHRVANVAAVVVLDFEQDAAVVVDNLNA
jgi:hypothetical protein